MVVLARAPDEGVTVTVLAARTCEAPAKNKKAASNNNQRRFLLTFIFTLCLILTVEERCARLVLCITPETAVGGNL